MMPSRRPRNRESPERLKSWHAGTPPGRRPRALARQPLRHLLGPIVSAQGVDGEGVSRTTEWAVLIFERYSVGASSAQPHSDPNDPRHPREIEVGLVDDPLVTRLSLTVRPGLPSMTGWESVGRLARAILPIGQRRLPGALLRGGPSHFDLGRRGPGAGVVATGQSVTDHAGSGPGTRQTPALRMWSSPKLLRRHRSVRPRQEAPEAPSPRRPGCRRGCAPR